MRKKEEQATKELKKLAMKNNGVLTPEKVVEFAKNPKTALHSWFEWDDEKASYRYRLWQARQILRVFVEVTKEDLSESRIFVSLKSDRYNKKGGGYRLMVDILSDDERREELLANALEEFKLYRSKYNALKELINAFEDMERALIEAQKRLVRAA